MAERTEELRRLNGQLQSRYDEMARMHQLTLGRELTMIELKKKVNSLLGELGRKPEYSVTTAKDSDDRPA